MGWKVFFGPNKWKVSCALIPLLYIIIVLSVLNPIMNAKSDFLCDNIWNRKWTCNFPELWQTSFGDFIVPISGFIVVVSMLVFFYLSLPIQPILGILGMTITGAMFTNLKFSGHVVVALSYGVLIYLLGCYIEYKMKK